MATVTIKLSGQDIKRLVLSYMRQKSPVDFESRNVELKVKRSYPHKDTEYVKGDVEVVLEVYDHEPECSVEME